MQVWRAPEWDNSCSHRRAIAAVLSAVEKGAFRRLSLPMTTVRHIAQKEPNKLEDPEDPGRYPTPSFRAVRAAAANAVARTVVCQIAKWNAGPDLPYATPQARTVLS